MIAPALPLTLQPKVMLPSKPVPSLQATNDAAVGPEPTHTIENAARAVEEVQESSQSPLPEGSGDGDIDGRVEVSAQEARSDTHSDPATPAALAPSAFSPIQGPDAGFRSVTPKASSPTPLSSKHSTAPHSAFGEPHTNGMLEAPQSTRPVLSEDVDPGEGSALQAQAETMDQSTHGKSSIMPRKFFSSEEPILDWADEMSEEIPADTLHIPSVPHLPELSSDTVAPQSMNRQASSDPTQQPQYLKPMFGSMSQELSSRDITVDTPQREGNHLSNGSIYTPEAQIASFTADTTASRTARPTTPLANGHARKVSQTPSSQVPIVDMTTHLAMLFATKEWADWTIQIISSDSSYPPVAYPAHGVVMSRSSVLRHQMNIRLRARPLNHVIILSPPRYVQPPAFEAALRYLYNEVVLTQEECARYCPIEENNASYGYKSYRTEFCFSYWLSGYILGLADVMAAGHELLREYLGWDEAELFIKASLDPTSPLSSRLKSVADDRSNALASITFGSFGEDAEPDLIRDD